jgi:aminoglycoside phosphotransferase (APT) family kinase protein
VADGASPPGVDLDALAAWAAVALPQAVPPFTGRRLAGGRSNITVQIVDARGAQYVVRRPPLHGVLPTAHDRGREHRIIAALGPGAVPVPEALAMCNEGDVLGAPFYVMAYVAGAVLNDAATAETALDEAARSRAGASLVDALAALHAVDPDAVGLGDLAKKDEYVGRQLRRWHRQFEQTRQRDLPAIDRVHDLLAAHVPPQREGRIVHGDWELCTLGDPLADVGYVLATWARPDDERMPDPNAPTRLAGFAERDELLARYAAASGRAVDDIDFYVAFSLWRLACILEGVYARARTNAQGDAAVDPEVFRRRVDDSVALAEDHAARFAAQD